MKILSTIIILSTVFFGINVQSGVVSGIVKSDLGESLYEVSIKVNSTESTVLTDCRGKFKVKVQIGDTLFFSKDGYLIEQTAITNYHRNRITLSFDYAKLRNRLELDSTIDKSIYLNASQPLFIIDGRTPESSYYSKIKDHLKEEYILPVKILKGKEATDLFGRCARNGAIWIRTKCGIFTPFGNKINSELK